MGTGHSQMRRLWARGSPWHSLLGPRPSPGGGHVYRWARVRPASMSMPSPEGFCTAPHSSIPPRHRPSPSHACARGLSSVTHRPWLGPGFSGTALSHSPPPHVSSPGPLPPDSVKGLQLVLKSSHGRAPNEPVLTSHVSRHGSPCSRQHSPRPALWDSREAEEWWC